MTRLDITTGHVGWSPDFRTTEQPRLPEILTARPPDAPTATIISRDIGKSMTHVLKTDPLEFEESYSERKKFEIRKADRDFCVDDYLLLLETVYTGA